MKPMFDVVICLVAAIMGAVMLSEPQHSLFLVILLFLQIIGGVTVAILKLLRHIDRRTSYRL